MGFLIIAALAVGLPLFLGALLGHYSTAILAGMGGLSILYMPQTAIPHRLITLADLVKIFWTPQLSNFSHLSHFRLILIRAFVVNGHLN
jgi:hypothetical protein